MTQSAPLADTYVAALQHGLADLPADATLVGVVRKPTRWLNAAVDENHRALGPPASLLEAFDERETDLKRRGLCAAEAHNATWDELSFAERYREHLETDPDARTALTSLADRLRDGEPLALVCYENTEKKRCHRTTLRTVLEERT